MEEVFMKGNSAIAKAALRAGLESFAGYPITPATEILEDISQAHSDDLERKEKLYPSFRSFRQMEDEIASINAISAGASLGCRVMTATASPGFSLMQEGISYIAGQEVPAVIVNIMRGGPGLGNIAPEQEDYFPAVKGGGNGGYKSIVLAPGSTREMAEHVFTLFNLTDKYRMPGILLADGLLAQWESNFIFPETNIEIANKSSWAIGKRGNGEPKAIKSLRLGEDELEAHKQHLSKKYEKIRQNEVRFEEYFTEDAEIIIVSYGCVSLTSKEVINEMRKEGKKVGLFRPITLWPFPSSKLEELSRNSKSILAAELSQEGQMVEDVRLAVNGNCPVEFYGRSGGNLISKKELIKKIKEM